MCQHAFRDERSNVKNLTVMYLQRIQSDFVQHLKDTVIRRLDRKLADLHLNHNLLSGRNKIRQEYMFYKEGVSKFEEKAYARLGYSTLSNEEEEKLERYRTQLAESKVKLASFTEKMFRGLDAVKSGWFQSEFKSLETCLDVLSVTTVCKQDRRAISTQKVKISQKTQVQTKAPSAVERALRETKVYIKTCTDNSIAPSYVRIKHTIIQNYGDEVFAKIKAEVRASCASAATVLTNIEKKKSIPEIQTTRNVTQQTYLTQSSRGMTQATKNMSKSPPIKVKSMNSIDLCSTTMSSEEEEEEEDDDNDSDESEGLDMSLALLTFGRDNEDNPSPGSTPPMNPFSSSLLKSSLKSPRDRKQRSSSKRSYVVDLKPSHVPLSASPSTSNSSMTTKHRSNANVMSPAVTRAVRGSRGRRSSASHDESVLGSFSSSFTPEDDALNTPLWSTSQFDDLFVGETKHFSPESARDGNKIINSASTITL